MTINAPTPEPDPASVVPGAAGKSAGSLTESVDPSGQLPGHLIFDTPLGPCGIAWSDRGVSAVALPDASTARTRAHLMKLARHCGPAPLADAPTWVADVIARVRALLRGERISFDDVSLDERDIEAFRRRVHALARAIPVGETRTYGDMARELGGLHLARAVGQALGANPFPVIVPCHRVVAARGAAGGFSSPGGLETKRRLLEIERATFGDTRSLFE